MTTRRPALTLKPASVFRMTNPHAPATLGRELEAARNAVTQLPALCARDEELDTVLDRLESAFGTVPTEITDALRAMWIAGFVEGHADSAVTTREREDNLQLAANVLTVIGGMR
jgi:hypothetical protein